MKEKERNTGKRERQEDRRDKERKRRGKEGVSGVWRKGRKKGREQDFSFLNISILLKNLDSK